jgi:hypothetical protein
MWETMNPPLFVLSNSGFQSFPGLKIQTWGTHPFCGGQAWARHLNLI